MGRLDGRTVLITGSTGIGASTAERAAAEGARVFIVSRTAEHARALAERVAGGWAAADLTDEAQVDAAVGAAVAPATGSSTPSMRQPGRRPSG